MHINDTSKRPKNPKENAGLFSKMFFTFAFETIRKGFRRDLNQADIYEPMKNYRSEYLADRLEELWIKKRRNILWSIFRMFGFEYAMLGLSIVVIESIVLLIEPHLMGKMISYYEKDTTLTREDALTYAVALIVCRFIWIIFDSSYMFMQQQITIRIRIALCSLLYRKSLNMDTRVFPMEAGGTAITIMTKDVEQFNGAVDMGHVFFELSCQLTIATYVMYNEIGSPALYGTSVIFVSIPICRSFTYPIFRKGYRKDLQQTDVYEILSSCSASTLGNRLEKEWNRERKKLNPQLLVPLMRMFGVQYALLGLALLTINTTLIVAQPLLIGQVVAYFRPMQSAITNLEVYVYAFALAFCITGTTFFLHFYMYSINMLSFKMKVACCCLIYRKIFRLNYKSVVQAASGQAVTLMTKDVHFFDLSIHFALQLFTGTVQTMIMTYIMYRQIGSSAFIGTMMLIFLIPFQVYLGKLTSTYRLKTASRTDERVKVTQEILTAIRIIKMYTWELFFSKSVNTLRKKEIRNLRILFYIKAIALSIGQLSSRLAFYICVMSYIALGNHITAEKAFVVTGCFAALRSVLTVFMPLGIAQMAELKASIQRIMSFLQLEEVNESQNVQYVDEKLPRVTVRHASIKTDKNVPVLDDINLNIQPGVTIITGSVGAGKSTLLKMVLGDVNKDSGTVEVAGKMSYASQEPWLFPGTVKQNIIFGEWYDEKRYQEIIEVCALRKDLDMFPEGDRTCVTDRGLNLSRGQKTRINLARAIYKKASIYLLDDCLSAVDAHVAKHIFYECIKVFLKDTVCILVTHQEQFLQEATNIIILNKGRVEFEGGYQKLKECDNEEFKTILSSEKFDGDATEDVSEVEVNEKDRDELDDADETSKLLSNANTNANANSNANLNSNATAKADKNIYEETKEEGSVKKEVYYEYFTSGGGVKMLLLVVFLSIMAQATASWSDYFVSFWVDMEQDLSGFRYNQTTNSTEYRKLEESHDSIMKQYSFVILAATVFTLLRAFAFFIFSSKASTNIHISILDRILNASMLFFDNNLSGNVLNRFSRDLGIIDEQMPYVIFECIRITLMILAVLLVVTSVNLFFLIPSAFFTITLYFARRLYLPTGRSIRRLEGSTRSPVIGHLNATLEGLTTIRASQAQKILRKEFDKHQDLYNSVAYMHLATTRAFGFYLDSLCSIYISIITLTFILFKTDTLAGKVGLAITQSFSMTGLLQWGVRQWAELENQMTSAERVLEYKKVEPEDKLGDKPTNWPLNGKITYEKVSLRYNPTNQRVLKNIDFEIQPKQKIGIVGRTGAGKTSIISVLFRMYDFRGTITIDDHDINAVAVETLRSKISIIPQDPVLFSGSIRDNLDPNNEYTDKQLWDALEEVEMKGIVEDLTTHISEGGNNYSIGQRQLFCLARAVVRNNVILVLDEATANIDPQTDALLQRTIRNKFKDCTVITIAHRLNTIMDCDRILVLDSGTVIEYDHPKVLLSDKSGTFYRMAKESRLV